ncbi:MAG TPA: ATP-binding protein, partial [Acidobacteriota bacterium]|nr:ATP-binding protein [Acidobacteriota bacterium]
SLNQLNFILNWLGLILLGGAILFGFKIARQAHIDARLNEKFLHETKQRTMEIAALYDTTQDVSGKQDMSALLHTILERARTLLNAAGCAIFLYDAEPNDFYIAVEVGVGMPIGTHLPLNQGLAGRVAEMREPLIVNDYQTWPHRSQTLEKLPIRAVVCVPMIRGGDLIGVLGVHEVDRTERVFTEAEARLLSLFADNAAGVVHNARLLDAVQNSEERFRIAAQCASDVVYDCDLATGHVDYFGGRYDMLQTEKGMLARTRREYWDLVHQQDRERVKAAFQEHLDTGKSFSEEYRIKDGKGSFIMVADRAVAIRNKKGKPVRLIGAISDVTERKRAEQTKSDFVSFVSHQLRTPLSGVKWMLELAMDAMDNPDEMSSFVQDARISIDRLIRLVNDLLDISRLEQGKLKMSPRHVDMAELTGDVAGEMTPLIMEKQQQLSIHAEKEAIKPFVDEQLVRQVLINLISNGIKYTPPNGAIDIRITNEPYQVRWEIKDTGIGIPKADMEKLFDKFYRAGNVISVETEGTGLGLYLVKLIVERFGGDIWCESEEGAGSTFVFTLPESGKGDERVQ